MSALFTALAVPETEQISIQDYSTVHTPPARKSTVMYDITAHVIALTSINEKAGVTTASMMLATLLQRASSQNRVAVLDLNTFNPDLYYYTENEVCEFISLSDDSKYSYEEIAASSQNTYNNFDCFTLFGDQHPNQKENDNLKQLLRQLSSVYNIIIIDTANYTTDNLYTLLALQNAHTALCVSLADETHLTKSEQKIQEFTESIINGGLDLPGRSGMLLNKTTTDLLTLHRKTNVLRSYTNIVGSFPKVNLPTNQKQTIQYLLDDPHVLESGSLVLKHIFNEGV